jgi:hypothetical protein
MRPRKERPLCRIAIADNLKLKPHIVDGLWDGHSYEDADGVHSGMSEGLRRQMAKMLEEGFWAASSSSDTTRQADE